MTEDLILITGSCPGLHECFLPKRSVHAQTAHVLLERSFGHSDLHKRQGSMRIHSEKEFVEIPKPARYFLASLQSLHGFALLNRDQVLEPGTGKKL